LAVLSDKAGSTAGAATASLEFAITRGMEAGIFIARYEAAVA
jgi:hypothetical protein